MKFKNFFAQHKRAISIWGVLLAIFCIAASPAFQTFNTDQFGTAGSTTVAIKTLAQMTNTQFKGSDVTFPVGQKFDTVVVTNLLGVRDAAGSTTYQMNNPAGDFYLTGPGMFILGITGAAPLAAWGIPLFGNAYGISNFLTLASNNVASTTNARTLRFWNAANVTNANGVVDVVLNSGGGASGIATNGGSGITNIFDRPTMTNATNVGTWTQVGSGSNWVDGLVIGTFPVSQLFFGGWSSSNLLLSVTANVLPLFNFYAGNTNVSAPITYAISVSNKTANYTILNVESGRLFDNKGATIVITNDLPVNPTNGMHYIFMVQTNNAYWIHGTNATIRSAGSVSTNSGFVQSSTIGSSLHLVSISTNEWYAESLTGTWTFQ